MPNSLTQYTPGKYTIYNNFLITKESEDYYNYKQELGYLEADKNTDLYCYNIMILNFLYGQNTNHFTADEYWNYIQYLESIGIEKDLINVFKKLLSSCDNESPLPFIESLNDKQIGMAKKIVYKLHK